LLVISNNAVADYKQMMDISQYYVEKGQGAPLILLHGNGEDSSYFVHQMEPFAQHFRVIALDTRGHGRTPRGEAPFTIRQFAEDLLGFLDEHHIDKAHLLGFSDGGNIALVFALAHPDRVGKLVLNGANLDPSGVKRSVQIPIEIGYRIAKSFAAKSPKAKSNAEMLGLMVNEPHIDPKELSKLTMPVLVVAGTRDMIKKSHTELISQRLPNAKLVFLEGDHFVAHIHPHEFNLVVDQFLQQTHSTQS